MGGKESWKKREGRMIWGLRGRKGGKFGGEGVLRIWGEIGGSLRILGRIRRGMRNVGYWGIRVGRGGGWRLIWRGMRRERWRRMLRILGRSKKISGGGGYWRGSKEASNRRLGREGGGVNEGI